MMSEGDHTDGRVHARVILPSLASADGRGEIGGELPAVGGRPRLRVQVLERTALIRFEDAELLFDEAIIRALGEQLDRLIQDERHARLLVNFGGVRHLSSAVLAKLAWLAKRAEPVRGRIQLCGLDPLLRDLLRITRLDGVFDICADEAEALGLGRDPDQLRLSDTTKYLTVRDFSLSLDEYL
jgi:anti-anti-sigma factor